MSPEVSLPWIRGKQVEVSLVSFIGSAVALEKLPGGGIGRWMKREVRKGDDMALIERVNVLIKTGDLEGAGTDGDVYAGVAGREFCCDSEADDFERGSEFYYRFGRNAEFTPSPMVNPERNDPRKQDLRTEDVPNLPVYIRFAPAARDDNWYLEAAALVVNNDLSLIYWSVDNAPDGLWLGTKSGLILHLRHHVEPRQGRFHAEMLENVMQLVSD